jgi:hypothetical protein
MLAILEMLATLEMLETRQDARTKHNRYKNVLDLIITLVVVNS